MRSAFGKKAFRENFENQKEGPVVFKAKRF